MTELPPIYECPVEGCKGHKKLYQVTLHKIEVKYQTKFDKTKKLQVKRYKQDMKRRGMEVDQDEKGQTGGSHPSVGSGS